MYNPVTGFEDDAINSLLDMENYGRMLRGEQLLDRPSGDGLEASTQLYFSGGSDLARTAAAQTGVSEDALRENVQTTNARNVEERRSGFNPLQRTLAEVGDNIEPITKAAFVAPFLLGAIGGAFGGGAAASGGSAAAGDGLAPITVGASKLPGGVAAVDAANAAAWGGAGMTSMPAVGGAASNAASAAGPILDSSGAVIPGTEVVQTVANNPVSRGGLLSRAGQFVKDNKDIIGSTIAGIGDSVVADQMHDNDLDLLRERQALTASNYRGANPGARYRGLVPRTGGQTPTQRFDSYSSFRYEYDPAQGKIVRVPFDPATAA